MYVISSRKTYNASKQGWIKEYTSKCYISRLQVIVPKWKYFKLIELIIGDAYMSLYF